MAQEKMKKMLTALGANLIGNVVKTDQSNAWASFITTPAWMFSGKKRYFSWLPSAGISDADMQDMQRFGRRLVPVLNENQPLDKSLFQNMGAVNIDEKLMMSEKVGHRSFYIWGKLLLKCGQISPVFRQVGLYFYIVFLIILILTVVPLSAVVKRLLKPLLIGIIVINFSTSSLLTLLPEYSETSYFYGILLSASGLGILIGAFLSNSQILKNIRLGVLYTTFTLGIGLSWGALSIINNNSITNKIINFSLFLFGWILIGILNTYSQTMIQCIVSKDKLDVAMADMKAAEDKLEAAYAIDTTAFTSKTEQDEYLNRIKELSQIYDEKLKIVKLVQEELSAHKGSTIAGRDDVTIV